MNVINHIAQAIIKTDGIPKGVADQGSIDRILAIVFGITGAIAVLMVVLGGLRYITAQGDPSGVAQAKKTIIYAIVGLIVTIAAYAIIKLVVLGVA